jgi:hypothetical protein
VRFYEFPAIIGQGVAVQKPGGLEQAKIVAGTAR